MLRDIQKEQVKKNQDDFSRIIFDLLNQLRGMKATTMNQVTIQALILTLYLRKDLINSSQMMELIFDFLNTRKDLPESLKKDLLWLIGKEICE